MVVNEADLTTVKRSIIISSLISLFSIIGKKKYISKAEEIEIKLLQITTKNKKILSILKSFPPPPIPPIWLQSY